MFGGNLTYSSLILAACIPMQAEMHIEKPDTQLAFTQNMRSLTAAHAVSILATAEHWLLSEDSSHCYCARVVLPISMCWPTVDFTSRTLWHGSTRCLRCEWCCVLPQSLLVLNNLEISCWSSSKLQLAQLVALCFSFPLVLRSQSHAAVQLTKSKGSTLWFTSFDLAGSACTCSQGFSTCLSPSAFQLSRFSPWRSRMLDTLCSAICLSTWILSAFIRYDVLAFRPSHKHATYNNNN